MTGAPSTRNYSLRGDRKSPGSWRVCIYAMFSLGPYHPEAFARVLVPLKGFNSRDFRKPRFFYGFLRSIRVYPPPAVGPLLALVLSFIFLALVIPAPRPNTTTVRNVRLLPENENGTDEPRERFPGEINSARQRVRFSFVNPCLCRTSYTPPLPNPLPSPATASCTLLLLQLRRLGEAARGLPPPFVHPLLLPRLPLVRLLPRRSRRLRRHFVPKRHVTKHKGVSNGRGYPTENVVCHWIDGEFYRPTQTNVVFHRLTALRLKTDRRR